MRGPVALRRDRAVGSASDPRRSPTAGHRQPVTDSRSTTVGRRRSGRSCRPSPATRDSSGQAPSTPPASARSSRATRRARRQRCTPRSAVTRNRQLGSEVLGRPLGAPHRPADLLRPTPLVLADEHAHLPHPRLAFADRRHVGDGDQSFAFANSGQDLLQQLSRITSRVRRTACASPAGAWRSPCAGSGWCPRRSG